MDVTKYGGVIAERMRAGLEGEFARARCSTSAIGVVRRVGEPTMSEVLRFIGDTGLPPALLLSRLEDVERGLDDLPRFDAERQTEGEEL